MSSLMNCPVCNHQILSRIGTICPNCNYTVGYFDEMPQRKKYGKFFALTLFVPFISFTIILFAQLNKYSMMVAVAIFFYLAIKSSPFLFKDIFFTKFEKIFFYLVWIVSNGFIFFVIVNILKKGF